MTNRFKGLDVIDTVPEEIWTVIFHSRWWSKPSPRKRMQKAKLLSEEGLQLAEKRREVKGKGEKERRSVRSVAQPCPILCHPMNHSTPGLPVHHQLLEFSQTHVHQVSDAIQPSHPLSSPSLPAPNPSQHQGLFQWVTSSHQVAKVLDFQSQHQPFQLTPKTDLL